MSVVKYTKDIGNKLAISARICKLQEKIFCAFLEMHYLNIFEEFIELDAIGFHPIQEIYYSIIKYRKEATNQNEISTRTIEMIIFSKIRKSDGLNLMYQKEDERKKYRKLSEVLLKKIDIILPKK